MERIVSSSESSHCTSAGRQRTDKRRQSTTRTKRHCTVTVVMIPRQMSVAFGKPVDSIQFLKAGPTAIGCWDGIRTRLGTIPAGQASPWRLTVAIPSKPHYHGGAWEQICSTGFEDLSEATPDPSHSTRPQWSSALHNRLTSRRRNPTQEALVSTDSQKTHVGSQHSQKIWSEAPCCLESARS